MASIRKETVIDTRPEDAWAALRLAPGFVTDTRRDGDNRIVTFANGSVVREVLIDLDDACRARLVNRRRPIQAPQWRRADLL
jgi:hypothetical protein